MKKLKTFTTVVVSAGILLLTACGATPVAQAQAPTRPILPDWVKMPVVENAIADTQCVAVKQGIGMNYLKTSATALARAELARQIGVKVKALDKTIQSMTESNGGTSVSGSFESVSKQVTEANLNGSRAVQMDYVTMPDNTENFCVMVAMSPDQTKTLFKDLIESSGNGDISPQDEAVLYERFLAERLTKELEAEL